MDTSDELGPFPGVMRKAARIYRRDTIDSVANVVIAMFPRQETPPDDFAEALRLAESEVKGEGVSFSAACRRETAELLRGFEEAERILREPEDGRFTVFVMARGGFHIQEVAFER